mmetsp:Transcript_27756/g.36379  ORF Transcript_27756/g.36379 Transcript_27756/m.36379 type:complete len:288 (+) Transcript_27756:144-1007(+)
MNTSTITPYINGRGEEFYQLFQWFPAIEPLYLDAEKKWDPFDYPWIWKRHEVPIIAVIIYLLFCYFGLKIMKEKKPFDLKLLLALWNLGLSAFSAIGMIRTVPHLAWLLYHHGFNDLICTVPSIAYGSGAAGMWTKWFILSKIPELGDTIFIVLRKKPLIFLHWYHHVTVLLYCWHSYVTESSMGIFFIAMNYSVHAIMYFYYFLGAIKYRISWLKPVYITIAQTSQMFVGVAVCIGSALMHMKNDHACAVKYDNLIAATVMYASYFALFFKLAYDRYIKKSAKKKA